MNGKRIGLVMGAALTSPSGSTVSAGSQSATTAAITPARLPRVATVDARYQSYNVEMAEVIGGSFWKPYSRSGKAVSKPRPSATGSHSSSPIGVVGQDKNMFEVRPPVDLSNTRLRRLAAALGPAYVRVSGTWANSDYFYDADGPAPKIAPSGFTGVLTRSEWKGVIDFSHAVDAKLVTSFAISAGVRDANGVWTPAQARKVFTFTRSLGGDIVAAEFFNEPDAAAMGGAPTGYNAAAYAKDISVFVPYARATAPNMRIVGPGSVAEGGVMAKSGMITIPTPDMLAAIGRPTFDIYSYHSYAAASQRCAADMPGAGTTAGAALSEEWLSRPDRIADFYLALRDRYEPGKPAWITETADDACGGDPWASTYLDSFRYLDQLGRLARRGVAVVFHNTLASSDYGLLDQSTYLPRPNYWAALLWHQLMGAVVLDAGPSTSGLHLYAHSLPAYPGGVTLLVINNSRTLASSLRLPTASKLYMLTADRLEGANVRLNGQELKLGPGDAIPALKGRHMSAGRIVFAPTSITFLAIADAGNASCR